MVLLFATVVGAGPASAGPARCSYGNQDSTCTTPLRSQPIPQPQCSSGPGWTMASAAVWQGSRWSAPQCNYQSPPSCPPGMVLQSAATWNGIAWVGLDCEFPQATVNTGAAFANCWQAILRKAVFTWGLTATMFNWHQTAGATWTGVDAKGATFAYAPLDQGQTYVDNYQYMIEYAQGGQYFVRAITKTWLLSSGGVWIGHYEFACPVDASGNMTGPTKVLGGVWGDNPDLMGVVPKSKLHWISDYDLGLN
ncbi:hypothetical protein C6T65_13770 [Burkholderia vietnamiensis]|uniref:Uncharacterized protein n=1 Tax=Burkholderia vietnamiensis TaxID=60552 RepID=A0AA44XZZ0_BURVI|nr:hypothetical protein C6T65_13770 [Burkholderia vietnamiensis]